MKRRKRESHIVSGFAKAVRVVSAPGYYPEKKRKAYLLRLWESLRWLFTRRCANTHYNLYGFDVEGADNAAEYLDYVVFKSDQRNFNFADKESSQIVLLRDKFLFYHYMKMYGLPTPEVFAVMLRGKLYDKMMRPLSEKELASHTDYFVKSIAGIKGANIKHIQNFSEYEAAKNIWEKDDYMFQQRVYQHKRMNELNPHSVNTIRIVTFPRRDSTVVPLATLLRIGTKKTGDVDNWSAGGIAIGIKEDGYLKKYGLYHMRDTKKTAVHPDTGIVFEDFQIPFYKEAVQLACEAQRYFYGVHSIGWDVAITDDGPVFIEGNDNYGLSFMQACDRPLRKEWEALMGRR